MTFVVIYWFVDAHKWFKGPKVCRFFYHYVHTSGNGVLTCFATRSTSSIKCLVERVT